MGWLGDLKRLSRQVAMPVFGIALLTYAAYHAIEGDRGLFAWIVLNQRLKEAHALADAVAAQKLELENRVYRLSSSSLDPDLLDERVRAMLDYARPDEVVIMLPPEAKAANAN